MQEAERGWAVYYLEVCLTPEEAEAAYQGWSERARNHLDAEVRVLRLPVAETRALYCLVTQTRELVPPEVLKWHEQLAAQYEAGQPLPRCDSLGGGAGAPPPPVIIDRTARTAWEKGVRTPEAWDEFMRSTARKRRRARPFAGGNPP